MHCSTTFIFLLARIFTVADHPIVILYFLIVVSFKEASVGMLRTRHLQNPFATGLVHLPKRGCGPLCDLTQSLFRKGTKRLLCFRFFPQVRTPNELQFRILHL